MTRYGSQVPTFQVVGAWDYTDGPQAVSMFEGYGVDFYPCQSYELGLFMARDADGDFASRTISISKPRQNGKSFAARHYAMWMAAVEGRRVLYTAHHGKTARKMFKLIVEFFETRGDFRRMLLPGRRGVYRAAGSEGIYLTNGGYVEFATRTNGGGRGDTYDVIVVDEAQELTDEEYDALKPTTLASESGDPQMIYLGTPPNEKCPGTVFRGLHEKAHDGDAGGAWWLEWAADELGDVHDVDLWYRCCPALGYRIREKVMRDAADSATSVDGFFREYLGWWSRKAAADAVIDAGEWGALRTDDPPKSGVTCLAVKFSLDGSRACVAACVRPDGAPPHVEVALSRSTSRGVAPIADWLLERAGSTAEVVIDGRAKSDALYRRLVSGGMSKRMVRVADSTTVTNACSALLDAVESGQLTHYGQPGLDDSATKCARRPVGTAGGWAFDGAGRADPLPVEAVALAHLSATTTRRDPNRRMRVG